MPVFSSASRESAAVIKITLTKCEKTAEGEFTETQENGSLDCTEPGFEASSLDL